MMPLFRSEALGAHDRLYGDVRLVPPTSWQIVAYFLFGSVLAAAIYLSLATHERTTLATGRIVALATRPGPQGDRLGVTLGVPADTVELIAPGETAHIAVDAFPGQMFGMLDARILTLSKTTMPMVDQDGHRRDLFVATALLRQKSIAAFGGTQPLRPGMTVLARIETGRRSLLAWLVDPMRATRR